MFYNDFIGKCILSINMTCNVSYHQCVHQPRSQTLREGLGDQVVCIRVVSSFHVREPLPIIYLVGYDAFFRKGWVGNFFSLYDVGGWANKNFPIIILPCLDVNEICQGGGGVLQKYENYHAPSR